MDINNKPYNIRESIWNSFSAQEKREFKSLNKSIREAEDGTDEKKARKEARDTMIKDEKEQMRQEGTDIR